MDEECFTYDGMTRKFIECKNLHGESTEIEGFGGTCYTCDYTVLLEDEYVKEIKQ